MDRFEQLLHDLNLLDDCALNLQKMRIAFLVGSGHPIDAPTFRASLEMAASVVDARADSKQGGCAGCKKR